MKDYQSLNHTRWDCKYHVVVIPKRRKDFRGKEKEFYRRELLGYGILRFHRGVG